MKVTLLAVMESFHLSVRWRIGKSLSLKSSYNDVISAVDDVFNQYDPNDCKINRKKCVDRKVIHVINEPR